MANLKDNVMEAFSHGKCAVERFWGQTIVYIPPAIALKVGEDNLRLIALEVFGKEKLKNLYRYYAADDYISLELPSVLDFPGPVHKDYDLPDNLVNKIMEFA